MVEIKKDRKKMDIDIEELKRLKRKITQAPEPMVKKAAIVNDGMQYKVRIPVGVIEALDVSPETHEMIFNIYPPKDIGEKPSVRIELVRKNA